jgi:hypothetical protein
MAAWTLSFHRDRGRDTVSSEPVSRRWSTVEELHGKVPTADRERFKGMPGRYPEGRSPG